MKWKKLRGKKLSGFIFFIGMFGWKERKYKKDYFLLFVSTEKWEAKKIMMANDNFTLISF